jgi:hypothetical protein
MIRIIFLLLSFAFTVQAQHGRGRFFHTTINGTSYYVADDGSGDGLSAATPMSIADFEALSLSPGDRVYFKRADTFEFGGKTVSVNNVSFGAFGSGADPIIVGSTSLSAATWTSETGGYYSTPLGAEPKWVFKDGVASRQGESAWITMTATATATTLTAAAATLNAFNTVESLVGAKVRYKEFNFRLSYEHTITGYNTGTGVITVGAGGMVGGEIGMPLKLYGQKQFATLEGDWWWDSANSKLWIKTTATPSGTDIRVSTEDRAFLISDGVNGTSFSGLEFKHYYQEAIKGVDTDVTITDCSIHDIRTNGVYLTGNGLVTITDNTIYNCGLNGLSLGAVHDFEISGNTIYDAGTQANIGWPIDTGWLKSGGCAIAFAWNSALSGVNRTPNDGLIELNTLHTLGYMGILIMGDGHVINKNHVYNFCTKWNDGGGIYSIHRASLGSSTKNITISNNIVHGAVGNTDGIGAGSSTTINGEGIYVDNGCELITVTTNTIYDCSQYGLLLNWDTRKSTVTNNLIYDCRQTPLTFRQDTDPGDSPVFTNNDGNVCTGNILSANYSEYCIEVINYNGSTTYNPFSNSGSCDNNYYIKPYYSANIAATRSTNASSTPTEYNLAGWQTRISADASSVARVSLYNYVNPLNTVFVTNPTNATVNVNPGSGYLDVANASLGSFDLGPFESKFYRVSSETYTLLQDDFTAANGTNISGRTPPVGPQPVIAAGTHEIQSNKVRCTATGGRVTWDLGAADAVFVISQQATNTSDGFNVYLRRTDDSNRMIITFTSTVLTFYQQLAGSLVAKATASVPITSGTVYHIAAVADGGNVKIYINNVLKINTAVELLTGTAFGYLGTVFASTAKETDYVVANPQ